MMAKANCSSSDLYSCMVGVVWGAFLVGDLGFRGGLPGWGWIGLAKGLPCQAPHHPTHGYGSKCWVCLRLHPRENRPQYLEYPPFRKGPVTQSLMSRRPLRDRDNFPPTAQSTGRSSNFFQNPQNARFFSLIPPLII